MKEVVLSSAMSGFEEVKNFISTIYVDGEEDLQHLRNIIMDVRNRTGYVIQMFEV